MRRMILPERVFGRLGGDRADLVADPLHELGAQRLVRLLIGAQGHIGVDPLPLDVVGITNDRSLGDLWMRDERALDLGGAEAVAGDIDDIVNATGDPVETVSVAARAVTGEVKPFEGREIAFDKALVIAIDGAHLAGPGTRKAEIALGNTVERLAVAIDDDRLDTEDGPRRRTRFERRRTGDRRDQNAARLGLPPGADGRGALVADMIVIPEPGFGVDRLADRAEETQRFAAGLAGVILALAHKRADRGRRGVEDRHLVLVDDLPEARRIGIIRHALEHQCRRAVRERAIHDIAVPRHPADIGGAP